MLCLDCKRRVKILPLLSVPGILYSLVCARKVISGTELGAPTAVCENLGWSDSFKSHKLIVCRTRPVLSWVRSSLAEEDRRQEGSSGNESSEDEILVTAREGRLAVSTKAPQDYIHRCDRDASETFNARKFFRSASDESDSDISQDSDFADDDDVNSDSIS